MYKNIGTKVKGLTVVLLMFYVLIAMLIFYAGSQIDIDTVRNRILLIGILFLVINCISLWPLYAIGEVAENTQEMLYAFNTLSEQLKKDHVANAENFSSLQNQTQAIKDQLDKLTAPDNVE